MEANDEDDALSLDYSLGRLIKSGGPSFREGVFRGEDVDSIHVGKDDNEAIDGDDKPQVIETKQHSNSNVSTSFLSSIGSSFAPTPSSVSGSEFFSNPDEKEIDGDDDKPKLENNRTDSPTNSEVGELPPPSSTRNSRHKRNSTVSIMKSSSSSSLKKSQYRRSVSWGHMVVKESSGEDSCSPLHMAERGDSESNHTGISIITFPNLRRAAPIRSDSLGSVASLRLAAPLRSESMSSSIAPLRLAAPLRSESMSSMASALSMGNSIPMLSRAHPVFSPRNSIELRRIPSLHRAMRLRSESTNTLGTEMEDDSSANSYNDDTYLPARQRSSNGAAWASPFAPRRHLPPLSRFSFSRQSSATSLTGKNILIRQASQNNYEGEGMEIDEIVPTSLGSARNFKSMLSNGGGDSVVSGRSRSSRSMIPVQSLDDGFVVRNLNFERHSSEILRSLSNEDLYSMHNVETLGGELLLSLLNYLTYYQ